MTQGQLTARTLSRRQLLRIAALGSVAIVAGAGVDELVVAASAAPVDAPLPSPAQRRTFKSRPDLTPPVVSVARQPSATLAGGLILLTPSNGSAPDGPTIVTQDGEPVWIHPVPGRQATNLQVATYRGQPVLTWWEGAIAAGYGYGEFVIADTTYREITRVHAGHGYEGDLHEFLIAPDDTAWMLIATTTLGNVPLPSGPVEGKVQEAVIQQVDIATGAVLFEWHSLAEIDPSESYLAPPTDGSAFDYLHANSIDLDGDGGLLVSARHTWTVYRIDRSTGGVTWRLNGRKSDFVVPPAGQFAWQHDARLQPDGSISIFDDGANGSQPQFESRSRGIVLALDHAAGAARLVKAFVHPSGVIATSQGSMELLPNGGAFVGWGSTPRFTEFDARGNVVLDGSFAAATQSYRSRRTAWVAHPADPPTLAVDRSSMTPVCCVSWNGATEVARWELFDPFGDLDTALAAGDRSRFETVLPMPVGPSQVAARALDANGNELGRSAPVPLV